MQRFEARFQKLSASLTRDRYSSGQSFHPFSSTHNISPLLALNFRQGMSAPLHVDLDVKGRRSMGLLPYLHTLANRVGLATVDRESPSIATEF